MKGHKQPYNTLSAWGTRLYMSLRDAHEVLQSEMKGHKQPRNRSPGGAKAVHALT